MPRAPIPSWFYTQVMVRHGDRFLLIQEIEEHNPWYLPAGRVEPGESFFAAAHRETLEEAGVEIALEGIVRIRHAAYALDKTRMHVMFLARPAGDPTPKSWADEHSLQAGWFTLTEALRLPQRSLEIPELLADVANGRPIAPLALLTSLGIEDP